jgi:hypothetical protein
MLTRVSIGVLFNAHLNILRKNTSARTNIGVPPRSYSRAGPKHPKITLPYSSVETTSAYTNYMRTRLLCSPNNLAWHLILLNADWAFIILFSNIVLGLFLALSITNPKYLKVATFSISLSLHLKITFIFICIAFVFFTLI